MTTVAGLATTLFLGGWRAPWPISVWSDANTGWYPHLVPDQGRILLFCFIWLRGTLPRIRYDQLMRFGWKVLIPVSLVWILVIATIRVWRTHGGSPAVYTVAGLLVVALLTLLFMGDAAAQRRAQAPRRRRPGRGPRLRPEPQASLARRRPGLPGPADGPAALPRGRGGCVPLGGHPGGVRRAPGHDEGGDRCLSSGPRQGIRDHLPDDVRKVDTVQYPEEKNPPPPGYHGRHQLNRWPDGLEKCIGCELCAWACPADAIYVEGGDNTPEERHSPASGTAPSTRSTTCAASCAGCAWKRARPAR